MMEKRLFRTIIKNGTDGKIDLVISLDGSKRVSLYSRDEADVKSFQDDPYAAYSKVVYKGNGEVETRKRPKFKREFNPFLWSVAVANHHDWMHDYIIKTFYHTIYVPRGIEYIVEVYPLDYFAEYSRVEIKPDIVEKVPISRMVPVSWKEERRPNIHYEKRSPQELRKLEKVRKDLRRKLAEERGFPEGDSKRFPGKNMV